MDASSGVRAFCVRKHASTDAERYLLSVRAAARTVSDVMSMPQRVQPAPLVLGAPRAAAQLDPAYDEAWIASALTAFATVREHIAWWVARVEAGASLPSAGAAAALQLQRASSRAWRELCLGEVPALAGECGGAGGAGAGAGAALRDDNVWSADGEEEEAWEEGAEQQEWEGGEGEGEGEGEDSGAAFMQQEGEDWEEEAGETGEVAAGGDGAGALPQPSQKKGAVPCSHLVTRTLPPLLTCVVGLDQLTIVRALGRGVQALKERERHLPLPLAEASWLYALLAALQVPFLSSTAALLRELFLLTRDQRRALGGAGGAALAAPSLLCVLSGRFFGQAFGE